jgi:hypothetical protein
MADKSDPRSPPASPLGGDGLTPNFVALGVGTAVFGAFLVFAGISLYSDRETPRTMTTVTSTPASAPLAPSAARKPAKSQ